MKEIIQKEYEIYQGLGALQKLADKLIQKKYSKIFILTDTHTHTHCLPLLKAYLTNFESIVIPAGEEQKTLKTAELIFEQLQQHFADRKSVLLNLGGGVITDLGGFCAATFKRGIDFIHIPTSLLAMVDAAIGGKTGLNLHSHKNSIGVFQHPKYIFIYPPFLNTLPETEQRSGLAEVCKQALISNEWLFDELTQNPKLDFGNWEELIFESVKIKARIVKKDPLEKNLRKTLNFGHTIGHAIETLSLQEDSKPLKHGEAVAIGMICESYISHIVCGLSQKALNKIVQFLMTHFPKYQGNLDTKRLMAIMKNDKKNRNAQINFTLLKKIGKAKIDQNAEEPIIEQALTFYKNL